MTSSTLLSQFFIPHVGPVEKERLESSIGPCTNAQSDGCDGEVNLIVCSQTLQFLNINLFTCSTLEQVHCPSCNKFMSPHEYEQQCVPLIQAASINAEDSHTTTKCPKCQTEVIGLIDCCPECHATFLSKPLV